MIAAGTLIAGKYEVKRLIGQGGMGAVYEGTHAEIGKRVAIKVIDPQHAGSEEIAARFRREARAASAVESDAIVQVFDVGSDPGVGLYMVMEFLTGEDLSQRLERERRLDAATVVAIGLQAGRALVKAHAAGVIHRDLKPANLFMCATEDGSLRLKILDFGISKLSRPDSGERSAATKPLTRTGVVIGTPQYMSPEQAQGLTVDARSDVWSLGAVLYEAAAGTSPFEEKATYEQTIIQVVTGKPKPLSDLVPNIPPQLAELIMATLVHDVDQRLPSCASLVQRLSELHARPSFAHVVVHADSSPHESTAATVAAPTPAGRLVPATATEMTVPMRATGSRASLAIAGVVGVVVLGGAIALLMSKHDPIPAAQPTPITTTTVPLTAAVTIDATLPPIVAPAASSAPSVSTSVAATLPPIGTKPHTTTTGSAKPSAAPSATSPTNNNQFGGTGLSNTL